MTSIAVDDLQARASAPLSATPRPFLRWAGSKQKLLPDLVRFLPETIGTYFEPFLGAGSMYFLLQPVSAVLSDACQPLIETYESVRDNPSAVLKLLNKMDVLDKDYYYEVRASRPRGRHQRAARFLYLNRACWNGLYRVNKRGEFNVPYGAPRTASPMDAKNLRACSFALAEHRTTLRVGDFEDSLVDAKEGDFVFLDPPYVTGHNNNGFVDYNERLFSWEDQNRLASVARRLVDRGVFVLVTNAAHDDVIRLYQGFRSQPIVRSSTLASSVTSRRAVTEVALWGPGCEGS